MRLFGYGFTGELFGGDEAHVKNSFLSGLTSLAETGFAGSINSSRFIG